MTDPHSPKENLPDASASPGHFQADMQNAAGSLNQTADSEQLQAERLKDAATAQMNQVSERAKYFASRRKDAAADQFVGISAAIDRVADELQGEDTTAEVGGYAHDLAGGVRRLSDNMRNKSVDEIVTMIQDFGRRQPIAFLGASALAGFVASRLVMASARRQDGTSIGSGDPNANPYDDTVQPSQNTSGTDSSKGGILQ